MDNVINMIDATNRLISNSNNRNYRERLINLRTRINVQTAEQNNVRTYTGEELEMPSGPWGPSLTQEQVDFLLTQIMIDN